MRNILAILLLSLLAYDLLYTKNIDPDVPVINIPEKKITKEESLELIKVEDVKKYVEDLSSKEFEGRGTGTKGNEKAADYICKHLDSLGITYQKQEFVTKGVTTANIIATISPANPVDDSIIVIGAHFDHLGFKGSSYYPGADDNASGVAGVMAIATALSKYKDNLKHMVSLQFYSAEEWGLIGSNFYTNNPLLPKENPNIDKHIAMINLDMIGYLRSGYDASENVTSYRDDDESTIYSYDFAINLRSIVQGLSSKYSFANNISGYKPGGSDHAPFYRKGIPVVFLHTGSHPHYHRITDTAEKLNYNGLALISKLALEILLEVDK